MPQLLPLLRRRYAHIARDLLAPLLDTLIVGRHTCEGDLDKLLILLVVAMRTVEHKDIETYDLETVLNGLVDTYPSLTTNVRSIADSSGIPKESVRRKVAALIEEGLIVRRGNHLALAPKASRVLTAFREELLQMAVRNHQTITALLTPEPSQET